jgi:hypothetical protein
MMIECSIGSSKKESVCLLACLLLLLLLLSAADAATSLGHLHRSVQYVLCSFEAVGAEGSP